MGLLTIEMAQKQVEQDFETVKRYHLTSSTMSAIKKFYDYKAYWLAKPQSEGAIWAKFYFQEAHSELKIECSMGRISPLLLTEIADFLRKGD